jgi:hypothetical protein
MDNILPVGGFLTQHHADTRARAQCTRVSTPREEDDAIRSHIAEAIHPTERALDGCQGRPLNLSRPKGR